MKNKEILKIKEEDRDFIEIGEKFLENLESDCKKYNSYIKKEEEKERTRAARIGEKVEIIYTKEILSKKSPMTIIHAPWGSGKTFFIEKLIENIEDNKIKMKYFKNIIYIDVWNHSNSKDVPNHLILQMYKDLLKLYGKNNNNKDILKKALNTFVIPFINKSLRINFDEIELNYSDEIKKIIKDDKILIIIDNIERLGKDSWEIIKFLSLFASVDNYCFLLPMNQTKLVYNQDNKDNSEMPINKFIDITYYDLEQDYKSLLNNYIEDEEIINKVNLILKNQINGGTLSIREVKRLIDKLKINKQDDVYTILVNFSENVWYSKEHVLNIFKSELNDCILSHIDDFNKELSGIYNILKIKDIKYTNNYLLSLLAGDKEGKIISFNDGSIEDKLVTYNKNYTYKEYYDIKLEIDNIKNIFNDIYEKNNKSHKKIYKHTKDEASNKKRKLVDNINKCEESIKISKDGIDSNKENEEHKESANKLISEQQEKIKSYRENINILEDTLKSDIEEISKIEKPINEKTEELKTKIYSITSKIDLFESKINKNIFNIIKENISDLDNNQYDEKEYINNISIKIYNNLKDK